MVPQNVGCYSTTRMDAHMEQPVSLFMIVNFDFYSSICYFLLILYEILCEIIVSIFNTPMKSLLFVFIDAAYVLRTMLYRNFGLI